ncbi:hypothetical protein COV15_02480 [Candidatus Woesearchaeota archaeon CG10_big_fil_rev_8_21_14_0_10_34_12]|nr:MAG: hypothetical protein COV15_02480 [Candidatus Woesearchaeota archaeon CG10_big_fil_rev_8_21_14_0_10_34_12]
MNSRKDIMNFTPAELEAMGTKLLKENGYNVHGRKFGGAKEEIIEQRPLSFLIQNCFVMPGESAYDARVKRVRG